MVRKRDESSLVVGGRPAIRLSTLPGDRVRSMTIAGITRVVPVYGASGEVKAIVLSAVTNPSHVTRFTMRRAHDVSKGNVLASSITRDVRGRVKELRHGNVRMLVKYTSSEKKSPTWIMMQSAIEGGSTKATLEFDRGEESPNRNSGQRGAFPSAPTGPRMLKCPNGLIIRYEYAKSGCPRMATFGSTSKRLSFDKMGNLGEIIELPTDQFPVRPPPN